MNRKIVKEILKKQQIFSDNLLDFFIKNIIKGNIKNIYYTGYYFHIALDGIIYYFMLNDRPEDMYIYCTKMGKKRVFANPSKRKAEEFVRTVVLFFNFNLGFGTKYQYGIEDNVL